MGYLNLKLILPGTSAQGEEKKVHIYNHNDRSTVILYILSLSLPLMSSLNIRLRKMLLSFLAFFFLMFIYERDWKREREKQRWAGEGQIERETESEAGSRLWDISTEPDMGLELMNHDIMAWAEAGHLTDWATQVPLSFSAFSLPAEFSLKHHLL